MKNTVLLLVAVLLLGLLGIGGWYMAESARVAGRDQAFADEAAARKLVNVSFVVSAPGTTPGDQTVYLSGSHPNLGAWQAAGLALQRGEDGKYHGSAELLSGIEHEFKVTRGTWGTVERDAKDQDIKNRPFRAESDLVVEAHVEQWVDKGLSIPGRLTLTGDLRVHAKVASEFFELPRDLIVLLPPNYDHAEAAEARYPVLYLNDGQNLFNEATSFAGVEWRLDEAMQQLSANGEIPPMIVVGVYNTEDRDDEYTPGKKLDAYSKLLVTEVKPMIDRLYRTQPGRETTGLGGSSLGGLAALGTAQAHPDVFGRVIVLSPWLRVEDQSAAKVMGDGLSALANTALYLDMGDASTDNYPEAADPVADAKAFAAALDAAGVQYTFAIIQGGTHHEPDWAARIVDVLKQQYAE